MFTRMQFSHSVFFFSLFSNGIVKESYKNLENKRKKEKDILRKTVPCCPVINIDLKLMMHCMWNNVTLFTMKIYLFRHYISSHKKL